MIGRILSMAVKGRWYVLFATLLIAHHLSLGGDTLEMMRAVLDTNFWLATHVVIVTLGYAATFVAGILGVFYVINGVFTKNITPELNKSFYSAGFAILCFAMLFSFVGTVLGGIWADRLPRNLVMVWSNIVLGLGQAVLLAASDAVRPSGPGPAGLGGS